MPMDFYLLLLMIATNIHVAIFHKQIVKLHFEDWQRKYKTSFGNENEQWHAYNNFEDNFKRMMLQRLKYFKGESKFLIEMNARACDNDKKSWTGAKFSFSDPKLLSQRMFGRKVFPAPPESLDYRELGLVTPVEDQGFTCSCCYAFAAACGLEGQIAKKYGRLVPLSKQNFVDCSVESGNLGCDGGYIAAAYNYAAKNHGIANSTSYPYTGAIESCQYKDSLFSANVISHEFVIGDEDHLKSVLAAVGPLPVGMRGSVDSFYYYSTGIYDDPKCDENLDHAVCLVGYGTDNTTSPPTNYWIIKNSWSNRWGENGYFRLKMGSNLCGIRNYVVYPIVSKSKMKPKRKGYSKN